MEQAQGEFEARGVSVQTADTRAALMQQFRENQSQKGSSGKHEITVVNIQRFCEDKTKVELVPYATDLQRIFIIDEAHRGYNLKGSFLANLLDADKNAIKIALTGTPLLKEERESCRVFGDYIHTYYYDKSIQDGYTLKIIREDIETSYKEKLTEIYEKLETLVEKKDIKKSQIVEHDSYVKELLKYIITDLNNFRQIHADNSLGGMIICETSEQARKLTAYFDEIQNELNKTTSYKSNLKCALILHDSDDKEIRKQHIKDFKKNMTVDILIVFNMLLTGFDANRLKRLYFSRKLKDHNLLQAITRVNRPYKANRYGYIIDFADIKKNFDETNQAYLKELNRFNETDKPDSDSIDIFKHIIEDKEILIKRMNEIKQVLFSYTTDNLEEFSSEISAIEDKTKLVNLKKILEEARDSCNIVRAFGDDELKEKFKRMNIFNLPQMISEVARHINLINQKDIFKHSDETQVLVNETMKDISFSFNKIGEAEMKLIAGGMELEDKWRKTISLFVENMDHDDPEYITLHEAFIQRFKEKGFVINSIEEFEQHSKALDEIITKLEELKNRNKVLINKYKGDAKFARVHKRIREENIKRREKKEQAIVSDFDEDILVVLMNIKTDIDQKVYDRNDILKKDAYFEQTVMQQITIGMNKLSISTERADRTFIRDKISREYLEQYNSIYPAA